MKSKNERLAAQLRAEADASHVGYKHYAGYWDNWCAVQVVREIRTKSGIAFRSGDYVLCSPIVRAGKYVTCYSYRTVVNTELFFSDISEID